MADAAVLDVDGDVIGPARVPLDCKLENGMRIKGENLLIDCVHMIDTLENFPPFDSAPTASTEYILSVPFDESSIKSSARSIPFNKSSCMS